VVYAESCPSTIGPITLEVKQTGERSAGNPHAAFDVAGAGNVAWSRYCDTRKRKSEPTVNTNFDLNRRASPRPYLGEPGGESPPGHSTSRSRDRYVGCGQIRKPSIPALFQNDARAVSVRGTVPASRVALRSAWRVSDSELADSRRVDAVAAMSERWDSGPAAGPTPESTAREGDLGEAPVSVG
jgi:hypothetical protein